MKRWYTDRQEITPGMHPSGVDHGSDGQVLVRFGNHLLVWRPGCNKYFGRGSGVRYVHAKLQVLRPKLGWGVYAELVFDGRWSKRRRGEAIDRIHRLMGLPLGTIKPEEIDRLKTLVVEDTA